MSSSSNTAVHKYFNKKYVVRWPAGQNRRRDFSGEVRPQCGTGRGSGGTGMGHPATEANF